MTHSLIDEAHDTDDLEDQTVDTGGSFDDGPAPAGYTMARFVGYVEVGKRKQPDYQGKKRGDCEEVRVYFELNSPKHQREVEIDGVTKTFTNTVSVKMGKKLGDKASFAKLLKKMSYGRDIKHMSKMLGEGFLIQVMHNTVAATADKKERTYANIKDEDGNWLIGAPVTPSLDGDGAPLSVPEPSQPLKLLLWNKPTQAQWDSLFIDGTRTVKDAKGVETEQSKNWLQEDIVSNAVNFSGSPLETMLGGLGDLTLTADPVAAPETAPKAAPVEHKAAATAKAVAAPVAADPVVEPVAAQKVEVASANTGDILADLGL